MQSFLSQVVSEVLKSNTPLSGVTFILPNKRSGLFLKTILKEQLSETTFLPRILSIEEFVKEISGFEILDNIGLVFEFYKVYQAHTQKGATDNFENFSKWASILLQDFNDLDSNLFDTAAILAYLSDTKRIEQWEPGEAKESLLIDNYLSFFDKIITYHENFKTHLKNQHTGYQGLVYREAAESIEEFSKENSDQKFIFAAFNALNKAEESIIQFLLQEDLASVYWDHDDFYDKTNHQSSQFFNKYLRSWPFYTSNKFEWKQANINSPKTIHFHGLPKNISQIKHVGSLLKQLNQSNDIKDTAVILGNEKLLPALLNSIPEEIQSANITMGYELQNISLASFFHALFKLHLNKSKWKKDRSFYYKDLMALLTDPYFQNQWISFQQVALGLKEIQAAKTIFISEDQLMRIAADHKGIFKLFQLALIDWDTDIDKILANILGLIGELRQSKNQNSLDLEYLYRFHNIFVQLSNLHKKFGYIENLNTLYQIFQQILKTEKLSFQGEPLKGLQIMGLLESRGLDFKNIIITSVNEGFLPTSGSNNSFIPLDLKLEKKIPTFFEKDAIFSYHFFRLLHRAEKVYLLYNNITDDFGSGEPSRFIKQLEVAKALGLLDKVHFTKKILSPKVQAIPLELKTIKKTHSISLKLKEIAKHGFSPSSLTTYIRNPLDFYTRSVLGIKEFRDVEETIAPRTFGTIIHDTLEQLYLPFVNKFLTEEDLQQMIKLHEDQVILQFKINYAAASISTGKNHLAFEISKQFVLNFLHHELDEVKKGKQIKILGLEVPINIEHQVSGLDFPVKLKGKIDRVDQVDGTLRIVDYKTGKVTGNQLSLKDWSLIGTEEKFSKSFQVLTYAFMYITKKHLDLKTLPMESGIISFKNMKEGFMPFNRGVLREDDLASFVIELDRLILEIFDTEIPFQEKELILFNK